MNKFPKTNEFIDFITSKLDQVDIKLREWELKNYTTDNEEKTYQGIKDQLLQVLLSARDIAEREIFEEQEEKVFTPKKELFEAETKLVEKKLELEQEMQLLALAKAEEWHNSAIKEKDELITQLQAQVGKLNSK